MKRGVILSSAIMHAMISDTLVNFDPATLTVPYYAETGSTPADLIRINVGDVGFETEYVKANDIHQMFIALRTLGIDGNIEDFDGTINLDALFDDLLRDDVLDSTILQARISEELFNLGEAVIDIPYVAQDGTTEVRRTVGVLETETEYVLKAELTAIFIGLKELGFTGDIQGFTGDVSMTSLFEDAPRTAILTSATLHARISQELINLTAATLAIPYVGANGVTAIRLTVGPLGFETEYVEAAELARMFEALQLLGFSGDIQTFDGTIDASALFSDEDPTYQRSTVLSSAIIHAKISEELIGLGATLEIPFVAADGATDVRLTVGGPGETTEYVVETELANLFEAMELLGFNGDILGAGFTGDFDLTPLFDGATRPAVLSSAIIHAKISTELVGLGAGTLAIPYTAADGATAVRLTVGAIGEETEYIDALELGNMFEAMELLGFSGDVLTDFTGEIDLTALFDDVKRPTVLASAIIHGKISEELVALGAGTLAIPYTTADGLSDVRETVGAVGFTTEYIVENELGYLFEAMELLGFTGDVLGVGFTGAFDLTAMFDADDRADVLASAIIHAKVSTELIGLGAVTLAIPYTAADGSSDVRETVGAVGFTTEYIVEIELGYMFEAMELLGFSGDVLTDFTGDIDLTALFDDVKRPVVLDSAIIHAKISTELVALGATLAIPYTAADGSSDVRETVGALGFTTEYIVENELGYLFEAMELLGFTGDVLGAGFTGAFDLTALFDAVDRAAVLDSSIIHAKVSTELVGLGVVTLDIPYGTEDFDELLAATYVRKTVGVLTKQTEYITEAELGYLFEGLEVLGFSGDVLTDFTGDINLSAFYIPAQRDVVLLSAILQAKISLEMFNLGSSTMLVPTTDVNDVVVRLSAGPLGLETDYITKTEIGHLFDALGVLGLSGDANFSGSVNLNNVNDPAEQDTLFASATMHATISQTVLGLDDDGILIVPSYTQDGAIAANAVRLAVTGTDFIAKGELKNLIEALIAMGYGDLSIVAAIDTSKFFTETATILASATMQATISAEVLALDDGGIDDALVVPSYTIDGVADLNKIRRTVDGIAFVDRDELEALFTALGAMGFDDLDSFGGGISSNLFFAQKATILLSSIMHATISDQLLNDTGGALLVPDTDVENGDAAIRVTVSGTEFITAVEISNLLDALDEMGLTNFGALDISIANIFSADFNILVASASMQATISDSLLAAPTKDETTMVSGSSDLVVPTVFRQDITVGTVGYEQIEEAELLELLDGLDQLGFTSFGSSMSGTATSTFDYATMMDIQESGSLHVTLHTMLQGSVAADTPDLAKEVALYGVAGLTKATEIAYFIVAVNTIGESDFTSADFSVTAILSLTVDQRGTVFDSMIVRNMLTDDIETAIALINANNFPMGPFYTIDNADYMESNPALFFTKAGALDAVAFIDSQTP
ncbi:MAG TPA: hypothetical protein DCR44_06005 [Acholeplasmatales bacterium]|nr:hypothetical protein [Acholeplasmatales bacterium]